VTASPRTGSIRLGSNTMIYCSRFSINRVYSLIKSSNYIFFLLLESGELLCRFVMKTHVCTNTHLFKYEVMVRWDKDLCRIFFYSKKEIRQTVKFWNFFVAYFNFATFASYKVVEL
jgi:hypothetical protein